MNETTASHRRPHLRRRYLIDKNLQLSIMTTVLGVLAFMVVLGGLAGFVLPPAEVLAEFTGEEIRDLILKTNASAYLLTFTTVAIMLILVTHRVAGPAMVLTRTIKGYARNDFSGRTTLRKKDSLKELAAAIGQLGETLEETRARQERLLDELDLALEKQDIQAVRQLIHSARVGHPEPVRKEPAPC